MTDFLSPHFTVAEFTTSQEAERRGIDNRPTVEAMRNLKVLAQLMETVRTHLGRPIIISSGYRCKEVNDAIGGAVSSQHLTGQACDFICPGFGAPNAVVAHLMDLESLGYDQIINEFGRWVHISWSPKPRRQVLTAKRIDGRVTYLPGLVS